MRLPVLRRRIWNWETKRQTCALRMKILFMFGLYQLVHKESHSCSLLITLPHQSSVCTSFLLLQLQVLFPAIATATWSRLRHPNRNHFVGESTVACCSRAVRMESIQHKCCIFVFDGCAKIYSYSDVSGARAGR